MTDVNIINCPSDSNPIDFDGPDGWNTDANGGFTACSPNGSIRTCRWTMRSYNYYGWAIMNQDLLAPGVDENDLSFDFFTDIHPAFLAGMGQVVAGFTGWTSGSGYGWDGAFFDSDASGEVGGVSKTVYRLREGIERFFITDINNPAGSAVAQSEVWVMMDDLNEGNPEMMNHIPGGCNVLYMDGHVEFLKYPSKTPVSVAWAVFNRDALSL
jgi:prepilin-type processing-associated H-X9-DG protein